MTTLAAARNLGFNDSVTVGERQLHVQTEVMGRQEMVICTTVLEGGTVRVAEKQVIGAEVTGAEELRVAVERQHRRHVEELREAADRGTY
jgi:hypothetical protein